MTEMYPGFDPTPHHVKRTRHNAPVWSSVTGSKLAKHGPAIPKAKRTRRPPTPVITRAAGHTIGTPVRKLTAADLKPQGLMTW